MALSYEFPRLAGELRLGGPESPIGGRRIALLEQIADTGSLTAAARAVGISYKNAWDSIHTMNNLAQSALVVGTPGGTGGGGSRLTAHGEQLLRVYRAAAEEQRRFLARLNQRLDTLDDDLNLIGRLTMQTSARNQFHGQVVSMTQGTVNTEVVMQLSGGTQLAATVTHSSAETLGIGEGTNLTALIKASWVIIGPSEADAVSLSTRNRITGTVTRIQTDEVNAEIVLQLAGDNTLAAVITRASADSLALTMGDTATAFFKASSVILMQSD